MPHLTGLHHLTAITADAPGNLRFYTGVLGLRLVKKTVNQDDTSAYHLFYADGRATPGTDVTFFDWPVARERRGTHAIARTGLRVAGERASPGGSERLAGEASPPARSPRAAAAPSLDFEDPEGQRLRLVDDGGAGHGASLGARARCRPSTRSAASGRSPSACPSWRPPPRC